MIVSRYHGRKERFRAASALQILRMNLHSLLSKECLIGEQERGSKDDDLPNRFWLFPFGASPTARAGAISSSSSLGRS
jgi:hypothetical protein